jgi:hypothetical protein
VNSETQLQVVLELSQDRILRSLVIWPRKLGRRHLSFSRLSIASATLWKIGEL